MVLLMVIEWLFDLQYQLILKVFLILSMTCDVTVNYLYLYKLNDDEMLKSIFCIYLLTNNVIIIHLIVKLNIFSAFLFSFYKFILTVKNCNSYQQCRSVQTGIKKSYNYIILLLWYPSYCSTKLTNSYNGKSK